MKILLLGIFILATFTSCTTIKDTTKNINATCPPKDERTLKNILCKEPK